MKKQIAIIIFIISSFSNIFASVSPNILINGYLGEDLPPTLLLKVDSTIVEDNGSIVAIVDNYNFSTNRTSINSPVYAYAGYVSSNNAQFRLTVSTQGFKKKDTTGTLIGLPLDVDIQFHTSTMDLNLGQINDGFNSLATYNSTIYNDLNSTPASFIYSVVPGVNIDDPNFQIWFTWEEKANIPAGSYGSIIGFSITTI